MERRTISIQGNVQKVGLRAQIQEIAHKLRVSGIVENLRDGSVLLICEAERQVLDEMIRRIKEIPEPVIIEDMIVQKTSTGIGKRGFQVVTHSIDEDILIAIRTGTEQLREIGKTMAGMDQKLAGMDQKLAGMDQKMGSIDNKMDISRNNDAQILEILKSMRDGGMLRITK